MRWETSGSEDRIKAWAFRRLPCHAVVASGTSSTRRGSGSISLSPPLSFGVSFLDPRALLPTTFRVRSPSSFRARRDGARGLTTACVRPSPHRPMSALNKLKIDSVDVAGKRVLIRVDFNVPQDKKDPSVITNTARCATSARGKCPARLPHLLSTTHTHPCAPSMRCRSQH